MAEAAKKIKLEFSKMFEDVTRKIHIDEFVRAIPAGTTQIVQVGIGDSHQKILLIMNLIKFSIKRNFHSIFN
jgi:hypothetical protein